MVKRFENLINSIIECKNNGNNPNGVCSRCLDAIATFKKDLAAAQEKEESGGTSLNSGYTTALEVCLRSLKLSKIIDIREGSILKVAACLNYVVKAQQNCA